MNAAQRNRKCELDDVFDANELWISTDHEGTVTVWDDVSDDGGDDDGRLIESYVMEGEGDPDEIAEYFIDWLRVSAPEAVEINPK